MRWVELKCFRSAVLVPKSIYLIFGNRLYHSLPLACTARTEAFIGSFDKVRGH